MTDSEELSGRIEVAAEGIGGIDATTVVLERGVNVLVGRNATNRTSFLQAIMAGLGSRNVSLKGDREEGRVSIEIDGERYTRTLTRDGDTIRFDGDPYLADPTEADLFAFLLERNEARQAVARGDDLRGLIMQPVDTAEIEAEIRECQAERQKIDDRIAEREAERERLPALEQRKATLEDELAAARERLAEAREQLDDGDADAGAREAVEAELEETLSALGEARDERDRVGYQLETEREALASAREELDSVNATLADVPEASEQRLAELDEEISALRERKRTYDARVSKLHRIVQFNEELLDGDGDLRGLFAEESESVTDDLRGDGRTCWTCGSAVERDEIEAMLARLRELSQDQRRERGEIDDRLAELTEEYETLESAAQRRSELAERRDRLTADVRQREDRIAELTAESEAVEERIAELEAAADDLEDAAEDAVLDHHRTVSEREREVERLEDDLSELREEIAELDGVAEELDRLETRREQVTERLTELRTRIDRLEGDAVDAFNEHAAELVDRLAYDNLARVWIERREAPAGSDDPPAGRRGEPATVFDLHVVRTTEDGRTYEDTVDHLSESEREVVGLVFALAGYLAHEVYETVPIMLLDSLEAIDAERIAGLVDYLADVAPTIVAALLPEDAQALSDSYARIREI